jgi:hypothetical protein
MSYIINSTSPFVSIKLTEKGREQLAQGQLNFSFWAIGDSEINYGREAIVDAFHGPNDITLSATSKIMRPFDRQPNLKSYITAGAAGNPFQPLTQANISVIKAVVNNEALERGFFSTSGSVYTTLTANTYTPYVELIATNSFASTSNLTLATTSAVTVGDIMLVKLTNDTVGNLSSTENATPIPSLWFKIQSMTGNTVTVDRTLPNYSASSTNSTVIIYRGGEVYETIATGNTTSYWDSGTLSFNASNNVTCHDVPVWNMNNVWCENIAGITGLTTPTPVYEDYTKFGSYPYLGDKNPYLEYLCSSTADTLNFNCNGPGFSYPDDVTKSISILHYTNNTISNLYGEFLYIDTTNSKMVQIYLPDLMYHRRGFNTGSGTTQGMRFISSGDTKLVGTSDIEYIDLIEDMTLLSSGDTMPLVVGRVYPQLKTIVIHDDEIVAAISYKSNRNWTLPVLSAVVQAPSGGTSTGLLNINDTIYMTYILENNYVSGLTTSLHAQNYIKLTNNSASKKDVTFRIGELDALPYMRKIESGSYDGLGFYADTFKLVYQIVQSPSTRPDPGAWKVIDFTSTAITGVSGETINPTLLENPAATTTGFLVNSINDSSATTFSIIEKLNMAPNNQASNLQFGDERFFYGNLTTFIGATIYKTMFDVNVASSEFNATTNPTRSQVSSTNPPNIKVSEVAIYDSAKNLVCIGKLSTPVALLAGNTIMIELSLDF